MNSKANYLRSKAIEGMKRLCCKHACYGLYDGKEVELAEDERFIEYFTSDKSFDSWINDTTKRYNAFGMTPLFYCVHAR